MCLYNNIYQVKLWQIIEMICESHWDFYGHKTLVHDIKQHASLHAQRKYVIQKARWLPRTSGQVDAARWLPLTSGQVDVAQTLFSALLSPFITAS